MKIRSPEAEDIRIIGVQGADQLAARLLGAVVVDGTGTTRVADKDVHQHEVPAGIAVMASSAHDACAGLAPDPEGKKKLIEEFYNDPDMLGVRQQGFLAAVDDVRKQAVQRLSRNAAGA